jgi:hypothetical protein
MRMRRLQVTRSIQRPPTPGGFCSDAFVLKRALCATWWSPSIPYEELRMVTRGVGNPFVTNDRFCQKILKIERVRVADTQGALSRTPLSLATNSKGQSRTLMKSK